ncbi:CARDB domain-containing protein, partial [Kamptonema cortianum]|nr:CARDB domain-containing protein [Kamptonema cortianum]
VTATPPPTSTLTLTPVPPTATPTPGPADLVISNITGPTTLMLGPGNSPVSSSFTVQITNTGQGSTGQFSNTISVSPPGTESPLGVVANLNPGESIVLNVSLTFNSAGTYNVQARVDSGNQVTEVSEVNNVGIFTVTVSPFSLSPLPLTLIPPFSTINFDLILPPTP